VDGYNPAEGESVCVSEVHQDLSYHHGVNTWSHRRRVEERRGEKREREREKERER
jgi:hypothetical protein